VVHPISSCASGVAEGGIGVDAKAADDVGAGVATETGASTRGIGTATGVEAGASVAGAHTATGVEADAPASTPVAVPIPPVDAPVPVATPAPTSSAASASTPVPPLATLEAREEMGWTTRNKFKDAPEDAHYHNLLTTVLAEYYPDIAATVKYYYAEHKHLWRQPIGRPM
jgi:hypothetical protein